MASNAELNRLARRLLAESGEEVVAARLRELMPRFYSHLKRARKETAALRRWGRCVNVDELTGTEIVDPRLLRMIGSATGISMQGPVLHAGLQHTYGYLLSTIKTPYGYKRDRWIRPTIEHGFALPESSLHAFPRRGTLLANLTTFLSMVACRDQRPPRIVGAQPTWQGFDFSRLSGWRITEKIAQGKRSQPGRVEIRTDVLPFFHPGETGDCALLVYTVRENDQPAKLITTFPIGAASRDELLQVQPFGGSVEVRLRFNAYVPGFAGRIIRGRRDCRPWKLAAV